MITQKHLAFLKLKEGEQQKIGIADVTQRKSNHSTETGNVPPLLLCVTVLCFEWDGLCNLLIGCRTELNTSTLGRKNMPH